MTEFTDEELDGSIDSGKRPFVVYRGQCVVIDAEAIQHFGLASGQNVSDQVYNAILRFKRERLQRAKAAREHSH